MAKRQMGDLDESVFTRAYIEVQVPGASQRIVAPKSRKRNDADFCRPRRRHCREDIRRLPGTADRDQEIARAGMELQLLGKDILVTEIIAQAGERRRIVERERP